MKGFLKYYIKDRWVLAQQKKSLQASIEDEPILIFTMAKVGSLSVYSSLKLQCNHALFHIHSLDEDEELEHIKMCKKHHIYPGSRTPVFMLNRLLVHTDRPYKIISLFRNPIERNLSAFFDAFELHMGVKAENFTGGMQAIEDAFYEKLNHNYAVDWYDKQFKNGVGVDVFGTAFNSEKKFKVLHQDKVSVLLLNSSLKDQIKEELIESFTDVKGFELKNVNVTAHSKHALLYTQFKEHMRFSKAYLDHQLNSKYVQHFFSPLEIDALRKKWQK